MARHGRAGLGRAAHRLRRAPRATSRDRSGRACWWRSACRPRRRAPSPPSPSEIGQWWRPNGLFQFTDGRDGTLAFEPGPTGRLVETYDDGDVVRHRRDPRLGPAAPPRARPGATPASPTTRRPSCTCASRPAATRHASPSSTSAGTRSPPSTPPATASRWPLPAALRRVVAGAARHARSRRGHQTPVSS